MWWVEARDAANHPACTEQPPPQRIIRPPVSLVAKVDSHYGMSLLPAPPGSLTSLLNFDHAVVSAWLYFSPFPPQGFLLLLQDLVLTSPPCAGWPKLRSVALLHTYVTLLTWGFVWYMCVQQICLSLRRLWVLLSASSVFFVSLSPGPITIMPIYSRYWVSIRWTGTWISVGVQGAFKVANYSSQFPLCPTSEFPLWPASASWSTYWPRWSVPVRRCISGIWEQISSQPLNKLCY